MKSGKALFLTAAAVIGTTAAYLSTQPSIANPPALIASFAGPTNFPGATNFYWTVESSTDLVNWQREPFEVSTGGCYIVHANGRQQLFFRWEGWKYP